MCSFVFRHGQKPLTLINSTLTGVISPIDTSTIIMQVGISAVPTEIKTTEYLKSITHLQPFYNDYGEKKCSPEVAPHVSTI